jgi:hypothetical protein
MELPVFDMAPFVAAGPASEEVKTLCQQVPPSHALESALDSLRSLSGYWVAIKFAV